MCAAHLLSFYIGSYFNRMRKGSLVFGALFMLLTVSVAQVKKMQTDVLEVGGTTGGTRPAYKVPTMEPKPLL